MTSYRLADCRIEVERNLVATTLPDGSVIEGAPHDTDAYRATARAQGYGDDVARMNRCHELGHSLVAHVLGLSTSPIFRRLAAGLTYETELTRAEEDAVLTLERFANALGVDLELIAGQQLRLVGG